MILSTVVALVLGVLARLEQRTFFRDRFFLLLASGAIIAPLSAAVTRDPHHSLRTFSLAMFAVLLSAYGADWVRRRLADFWSVALLVSTLLGAAAYLKDYFVDYPARSIAAFETYGLKSALERAVSQVGPNGRVLVHDPGLYRHIVLPYYRALLAEPLPEIRSGARHELRRGDVFVFRAPDGKYAELRRGQPEGSLYAVQRHDQLSITEGGLSSAR